MHILPNDNFFYCDTVIHTDTVNLASTMERTSKKMKIQVAEMTYRLLQDAPNMNFQLKKRSEGVDFGDKGLQNA
jgi:class 3 adenylate cyclase